MSPAQRRLARLAALFVAGFVLVALYLAQLMLEQNPEWLERSHRNRWAFRDVPSRRGSILDRNGVLLVRDVPSFRLELDYETFRRRHPAGAALDAVEPEAAALDHSPAGFEAALAMLLARPVPASGEPFVRVLQLCLSCSPLDERKDLRSAMNRARREHCDLSLGQWLGETRTRALLATFRARVGELEQLDRTLRQLGDAGVFEGLERGRQARLDAPASPVPLRVLRARIPFELAAWVGMVRELHPGILVQPDVVRESTPALLAVPSLAPIVGMAASTNAPLREPEDAELRAQVRDMLTTSADSRDDLPEDVLDAAETQALAVLRSHLESRQRLGLRGVEADANEALAGLPGLRWAERDARARERGLFSTLDVTPGRDVRITVDLRLQQIAEAVLRTSAPEYDELERALVLIEPATGDVLAVAAVAAQPQVQFSAAAYFSGNGALGSVAKPFVQLEHLDAQRSGRPHAPPGSMRPCTGSFRVARTRTLGCDKAHGAQAADAVHALAHSCNVWFYQLAAGLGHEGLVRAFARAGWMPGDAESDPRRFQPRIAGVSRLARSGFLDSGHLLEQRGIGYGLQAPALQVARAYAGLATGALPTLSLLVEEATRPAVPLGVDPEDLRVVREGLRLCVVGGTAAGIHELARFDVLGKTGTAEISKNRHNNAWFAGYLRGSPPALAFAAVVYDVPDGVHGAEAAGTMIAQVLERIAADEALRTRYLPGGG